MISLGAVTVKLNLPLLFYRKFAKRQGQLSKVTCKPARPQQPGVTKQHTKRPPPLAPSVFGTSSSLVARTTPITPLCPVPPPEEKETGVWVWLAAGQLPCLPAHCPANRVSPPPPPPLFLRPAVAASVALCGRQGGRLRRGPLPPFKGTIFNFALLRSGGVLPFQSGFARSP